MVCQNCEKDFEGNYCHNCGQKSTVERITFLGLLSEAFYEVIHFEKKEGFLKTVKVLTFDPGKSIRSYLEGKRKKLYPSSKYLFFIGAIATILTLRYHFFSHNVHELPLEDLLYSSKEFLINFSIYVEEYTTIINIITIPVFTLFSWVFFRYSGKNYAENLILNTYITAHQLALIIVFAPFFEFFPAMKDPILIPLYVVLTLVYNYWVLKDFFGVAGISEHARVVLAIFYSYIGQLIVNLIVFYLLHQLSPGVCPIMFF